MSDTPDPLIPPDTPPVRDRRIVVTAALSIVLHLAIVALLMLPRLSLPEAAEPPPINVDLVPPDAIPSEPSSSEASSSPVSSEQSPSSSEEASSASAAVAPSSTSMPLSSEASASASSEAAASEAPSSAAASSEEASSGEASSTAPAAAPSRPIVIPVGPSAPSSEPLSSLEAGSSEDPSAAASDASSVADSSAASESDSSVLATASAGDGDTVAEPSAAEPAATAPAITGALHTARRFYLAAILDAPAMAKAKDAIRKLPPEKRLTQTCNIEAVGQLGNAGRGFTPDAVVADAFGTPAVETDAATVTVSAGAFRSGQKWYAVAYTCRLSPDLSSVKSFSYRVGGDVTAQLKARLGR